MTPSAVDPLPPRDPELLAECRALVARLAPYPTVAALEAAPEWPEVEARLSALLSTVRRHVPKTPPPEAPDPTRVRAVHWNIEHGNWWEPLTRAFAEEPELADADLYLLNEVDLGMARAGNRDVAFELAARLHRHAAWAPLFLETGAGRHDDFAAAGGRENAEGLFGLAILSRWPIGAARIVRLPSPQEIQFDRERMYGFHIALVVEIQRPGAPLTAVTAHLNVHRDRVDRARELAVVLEALRDAPDPVILSGDFNTHTFDRRRKDHTRRATLALALTPDAPLRRRFRHPESGPHREFLFEALAAAGFTWEPFIDREPTLQVQFERLEELRRLPPFLLPLAQRFLGHLERRGQVRLDWFAGRGWSGGTGRTVTGVNGPGRASDHAPIVAEFRRGAGGAYGSRS